MTSITNFKDLIAWQKAMDVTLAVYGVSKAFPPDERFGLTAQVRRAAVSVPSNIAEGFGRCNRADFSRFLDMARGSLNEVETQLILSERLNYVPAEALAPTMSIVFECHRIVAGLTKVVTESSKSNIREERQPGANAAQG